MKKLLFLFVKVLLINQLCFGQSITLVPSNSTSKGMLDLSSVTNGFLPPRMKAIEKDAILAPAEGLIVYQIDSPSGLYIYNGRVWVAIYGWSLTGNSGTDTTTNFIGTTDNTNLIFKRNNVRAGKISVFNTSFGLQALNPATGGKGNSAFGNFSLWGNTTGGSNTSVGDNAMFSNISGSYNTANGYRALYNNVSGNQNTAYGNDALFANQSGKENVAIGNEALMFNKLGEFNTALGSKALKKNIDGSYNTVIGASADVSVDNLTNATAIGSYAKVSSSNSLVLGSMWSVNSGGEETKVGIGVTAPEALLHVNPRYSGGILIGEDKSSGDYTTLEMGISERIGGYGYIQATQETASGPFKKLSLNPDGGHVGINHTDGGTIESPLDIQQSYEGSGLKLRNKNYDWDLHVLDNHNFGFSYVGGAKSWINAWDGTWNTTSDSRLKKNVNQMGNVLDKVLALQPKTYQYINNESDNRIVSGFIAQDVMLLFPELVSDFKHATKDTTDTTVYHGLNYAGFSVIAIKAIQEQQQEIESLKGQLKLVLEEIERLKKK
jgi:trimeric autotransporter adhesin